MAGKMVAIKRTAADKKERESEIKSSPVDRDDYPYGSRLELDHDTLEKLGLHKGDLPGTGDPVAFQFKGHISRAEEHMVDGESRRRLELQLTHAPHRLGLAGGEDADGDNDGDTKPGAGVRKDLEAAFAKSSEKTDAKNAAAKPAGKPALA